MCGTGRKETVDDPDARLLPAPGLVKERKAQVELVRSRNLHGCYTRLGPPAQCHSALEVDVMADCFMGWTLEYARRMMRALAPFDLRNQLSSNRTQGVPNMIALVKEHAARLAAA